jgi:hypothetical protein
VSRAATSRLSQPSSARQLRNALFDSDMARQIVEHAQHLSPESLGANSYRIAELLKQPFTQIIQYEAVGADPTCFERWPNV